MISTRLIAFQPSPSTPRNAVQPTASTELNAIQRQKVIAKSIRPNRPPLVLNLPIIR